MNQERKIDKLKMQILEMKNSINSNLWEKFIEWTENEFEYSSSYKEMETMEEEIWKREKEIDDLINKIEEINEKEIKELRDEIFGFGE